MLSAFGPNPQRTMRPSEIQARPGNFPEAPVWNISLTGIFSSDVALQLLNRMFLSGDDPLHQIADGEYTLHGLTLHDREMPNTAGGHDGHALVDRLLRSHEHNWASHDLPNASFLRRPPFE